MQITEHRDGSLKPEDVDPSSETVDQIKVLADKDPHKNKEDANEWKRLACRFVVAAMPDYLKPIVLDSEFKKFLQKPANVSVAQGLLQQLLVENEARYPEEHNS